MTDETRSGRPLTDMLGILNRRPFRPVEFDAGAGMMLWSLPDGRMLAAPLRTPYPYATETGEVRVPAAWVEVVVQP